MTEVQEAHKESYTQFLLLTYALLALSAVSAAFAYMSSAQGEQTYAFAYLGLCASTLLLFALVRHFLGPKVMKADPTKKKPAGYPT
jgi:hypothetical protein